MHFEKVYFWGCELAKGKSSKWIPRDESVSEDEDQFLRHSLIVQNACLGSTAKPGEMNIIEATGIDINADKIKHPIIRLSLGSCEQATLRLPFTSEVSFKLVSGSGPVHLTGSHEIVLLGDDDMDSDDDMDEDEETSMNTTANSLADTSGDISPGPNTLDKRYKRQASLDNGQPPSKKSKQEQVVVGGDDSDESDDEDWESGDDDDLDEEEGDSSDDDTSSADKSMESPVIQKSSKKMKTTPKVATPKSGKKSTPAPVAEKPKQKTPKVNAVTPKVNTATPKGDSVTPKSSKKEKKEKKAKQNAESNFTIEEMKKALAKSPGLPKKEDKFINYCKQRFRVEDPYMLTELWSDRKLAK